MTAVPSENQNLIEEEKLLEIQSVGMKIQEGARAFLSQEFKLMGIFVVIFSVAVFVLVDYIGKAEGSSVSFYATISFIIGSITSMLCGFIGMSIATSANYRTTF